MADPTPIQAAQQAKRDADAAFNAANQTATAAEAAARQAERAAKAAETAAQRAQQKAQRTPNAANNAAAASKGEAAATARQSADAKKADAATQRAAANDAKAAKAKADADLAKLTNEKLKNSLPAEEWDEIVKQIELNCGADAIKDGVVKPCGKIKRKNCAGPDPDKNARMDAATQQAINTANGTNIDFNKLGDWEGGQATQAYVPWFPLGVDVKDGAISANTTRVGGGSQALAGNSRSGVTIGTGVDLGQQDKTEYAKRLRGAGASEDLINRLTPYMGLTRSEACRYLREHPLTLTKAEADLVDKEMKSYHLAEAKKQYTNAVAGIKDAPKFGDLSQAEQTVLMSRKYQDGNLSNAASRRLMQAMGNRNDTDAVNALSTQYYTSNAHTGRIPKEHDYLQGSYPPPAPAAPGAAPGAAPAAPPRGGG